jgi:hypothetical protein
MNGGKEKRLKKEMLIKGISLTKEIGLNDG